VNAMPYSEMSDLALLELLIWREARGEPTDGKRAVAHVVKNRSLAPSWWNAHTVGNLKAVVLQKWQFSSFNLHDPNSDKWPQDDDPSFAECCAIATSVINGADPDNTAGATSYFDTSIEFPSAWGPEEDWEETLDVGHLRFFKPKSLPYISLDEE